MGFTASAGGTKPPLSGGWRRALHAGLILAMVASTLTLMIHTPVTEARSENLRWAYYVTYDPTSLTSLQAHIGQIDVVSPAFYQLDGSGNIVDNSDPIALSIMRGANVLIIPMIQNIKQHADFHKEFATGAQREAIANQIANLVISQNYAGINIDFEGIDSSDGSNLVDFMQRLGTKLHAAGKLVTEAIPAKTSDTTTGWGGAFNYQQLGAINDYVVIMGYDFHYAGGPPGAIAPISWVQQVISYAQSRMSSATILLGIGLFGYDWDTTKGGSATARRFDQTQSILQQPGVKGLTSGYDGTAQAPWVKYTDSSNDQHTLWYENTQSFSAKLQAGINAGLGGFALWRLGQEDPGIWGAISQIATPATRIPPFTSTPTRNYYPETGHSLSSGFLAYWSRNGGLPVFGYPITEEFSEPNSDTGGQYTVQYFERERFEYHPENQGTPYEVELGRLGAAQAQQSGLISTPPFTPLPANTPNTANCTFFPQTGHRLCFGFRTYWQTHGLDFGDPGSNGSQYSFRESLALFGYPISEEFTDPATGLTVQYFERARFEYHPNNPTQYQVLLGLLGNNALASKGWLR